LYSSKPKYSKFYQLALGVDLSVKSDIVFNEDLDTNLLFWAPKWTRHYPREKTILFTGPVTHDKIFKTDYSRKRKESRKKMGLDNANRVVIIALNKKKHIGIDGFMKFAEAYKCLFQSFVNTTFILKVHPLEELAFCEKAFDAKMYGNVWLSKNSDWEVLLAAADTFITHWSSTLYNSIAAGLPTILFSPFGDDDFSNRNLDSFQFLAKNKEMLSQLVSESFSKQGKKEHLFFRERFISEQMLFSDGHSAARAAGAIRKICHSGNPIFYNVVNNE
jgi:CDP-glycerol glycerophosphotransferase (TagB/SpsB family)